MYYFIGGSPSEHLLKVTLDLVSTKECNNTYKNERRYLANGIRDDSQLCAGYSEGGRDTCQVGKYNFVYLYEYLYFILFNVYRAIQVVRFK